MASFVLTLCPLQRDLFGSTYRKTVNATLNLGEDLYKIFGKMLCFGRRGKQKVCTYLWE